MKLSEINPYVRFARVQEKNIQTKPVVALDHRAFYCISGETSITVADKEYKMKKGSLIIWRAGISYHGISNTLSGAVLLGCNFDYMYSDTLPKLPVSYVDKSRFQKEMLLESSLPDDLCCIPDCIYIPYAPLEDKFKEIIKEYTEKELFYEERCSCLMKDIIVMASRISASNEKSNQKYKTDIILTYIREHFNENLNNESIARYFNYHPNYISNLIKKRTGVSLHKYLLQYRIHMAILFLQSGKHNVTETASLVGFSDIKHFSKTFSLLTGVSPSSYRINEL